jgi:YegS/Rv2252/BmrU family lipid kinase
MSEKNWLAIINPNAGAGKCARDWPKIKNLLEIHQVRFDPVFTERRYHAMVLSRKMIREGYTKIIVVGGDGTMNEVINGLFSQKALTTTDITLGMIPVGTGNDWARMFGISFQYEEAIKTLIKGKTFIQDAGRVLFNRSDRQVGRYFINIAGLGFDALVTRKSNNLKERGKSSKLLYFWNILTSLFGYKHFHAAVTVDGNLHECDIFSMNVGICQFNGGGMKQVPTAIPDDGIFDLTIIKKIGKFEILRSLPVLYNGKINSHPKVISLNGKKIQINSTKMIFLETDGENLGHTPFEFEIIPRSVKIVRAG